MNTKELAEKLEKEKNTLEAQLQTFAKKDTRLKGDWDTKFPKFDGEFGSSAMETAADEVEEYASRLPVEYSLELRLRDIDLALEKIKKGNYGKCEKCGKEIDKKRLEIHPAARLCIKCSPR